MSTYNTNRPGIPLATKGYVSAVNDRFVQQTVLSDGTATPANINVSEMARVAFSIEHAAVRLTVSSMGGAVGNVVRSQATSLNISQKTVRIGVSSRQLNLSLSKN